ncbi:hypothetical protein CFAM422_003825 [Trichoderma lentiforme]|uniref:Uncharacterized protein n=1 Tax=Trichoderma lentiforme TaxID=1567552 RepID=A0A9P4XJH6_9HYPO|nr:hypothetical protein CFAM422_003825 [Trichoderma lentiforme]
MPRKWSLIAGTKHQLPATNLFKCRSAVFNIPAIHVVCVPPIDSALFSLKSRTKSQQRIDLISGQVYHLETK